METIYATHTTKKETRHALRFDQVSNVKTFSAKLMLLIGLLLSFAAISPAQTLTLLSPNGGETWMSGTSQTIQWQLNGDYADLYIEFSEDGGNYWYYIAYVPATDSTSELTFINNLYETQTGLVRISLYNDAAISDESDSVFAIIQNPIYFYTPFNGQGVYAGVDVTLSWYSYFFDTFDVYYTIDGGAAWTQIASSYTQSDLVWSTPTTLSDQCMIKVADANNPADYGLSATFSLIEVPTATIISPNGGETWNYNSPETVSWSGTNLPYYLYIEFSDNGGQNWEYLGYGYGEATGGSVNIYVPYSSTDSALVRLVDPEYGIVLDVSDQLFHIFVPPVIMYNPWEGQQFYIMEEIWINWWAPDLNQVNIDLSTDFGESWVNVAENIDASAGWYSWTLSGTPSDSCLVRVSDASDATQFGICNRFVLMATPVITLNNPVGGEIWNTDSVYTISWTYDNLNAYYVVVDYSADNGQSWNYLGYAAMEAGEGSMDWTTPPLESDQYLIRVRDTYYDFVSDTSGLFSVRSFPDTPICIVSVDSATNNNIVIWEKPASELISNFIIYKESDESNIYLPIGTVAYDSLSIFTDANSNPAIKSYRYKLGFSDAEGNVYPMGALHQTIHLSINKGVNNSWNLIWNDYKGFTFPSYNIYRSFDGTAYEMIATISSSFNSYTDIDALNGEVFYYIEVINSNGCNPTTRGTINSLSNIATNNFLGIDDPLSDIGARLYPNPASHTVNLKLDETDDDYRIQLLNLTGKVVMEKEIVSQMKSQFHHFDVSLLENGFYFVRITTGNRSATTKIIIWH